MGSKKENDRQAVAKRIEQFKAWPTEKLIEHIKLPLLPEAHKAIKQILSERGVDHNTL